VPRGPLRRAQLVAPFGVGGMVVVRDGTSVVCGGLDGWYRREDGYDPSKPIVVEEYKIEEWRLQRQLNVSHFRLPPDFRDRGMSDKIPNFMLTVPFLRFPQWHFCPSRGCKRLYEFPLSMREKKKCDACALSKKTRYVLQVPFVAICSHGHLQDFPWREWVHRTATPNCDEPMRLFSTGGASLAAQKIVCDCKKERSLASITDATLSGSFLSNNLDDSGEAYLCRGLRPWLGAEASEPCIQFLRGSLRSASNVYFAQVRSAIYLPRGTSSVPPDLVGLFEEPPLSTIVSLLVESGVSIRPELLRNKYKELLEPFTDDQISEALEIVRKDDDEDRDDQARVPGDDYPTAFLRAEFEVLKSPRNESQLIIEPTDLSKYDPFVTKYFSGVNLIHKLRETRALSGFTRVVGESDQGIERLKSLMWKDVPKDESSWLPAYLVFGEGVFIQLNEERLHEWEEIEQIHARILPLMQRDQRVRTNKGLPSRTIWARYVLLHTFAHLLMNRLIFECGYSSASLRERLFVSANPAGPMAGLLIYTAAGDAEGTMGGLVRMGKPGYLEPVIARALDAAQWCSADPVCMEMGSSGGQGPDSCNLAACHNCALVPETACESFNRFLDRALVIGDIKSSSLGYFA
jgi:hypothetical protein